LKLKKALKEGVQFTGDHRETFPEYYNNEFIYFKYFTEDGKGDDEESEDLVLKEIEPMFQNLYL
jgi:hypothetical protein